MPTQRAERMPTTMHNRVTIEDIPGMPIGDISGRPIGAGDIADDSWGSLRIE